MKTLLIRIIGVDLSKGETGIGPNAWGWFRIIFPFQKRFYYAAKYHDIAYDRGGTAEDMHRANLFFFRLCMERSNNLLQGIIAFLYLAAVEPFGKYFFNFHFYESLNQDETPCPFCDKETSLLFRTGGASERITE